MTGTTFTESFDTFDETFWLVSDFAIGASFIDTAWSPDNVIVQPGEVQLELNTNDLLGKSFTGAEFKTAQDYWYGTYSVVMQITDEPGVLTSFFMFTGEPFDDPRSEIDIEFRSNDPTKVDLTIHTPDGSSGVTVDLGFDASAAEHTYAFEWTQDSVEWYADGVLLHTITSADFEIPEHEGAVHASIWTGSNSFTGTPTFTNSTASRYSEISFTAAAVGTDTTADANANLSVSISGDTTIDASEVLATFFTISGLDGDATAVVTVSDGVASVSKTFVANGPGFLNLTGLADGALTSLVTATDTSGNVATVSGPGLTLDTTTGLNIVEQTAQNFNGTNAADLIDASDTLFAANNFILAGDQNDLVRGNAGNDQMHGGNGSDQIYGGDGHDYVYGQNGADALFGDVGSDGIFGGKGEDTIEGGAGNDVLRGGGQSDAFLYAVVGGSALGDDRIDDFNAVEGDAIVNTGDVDAALILSVGSDGKLEGSIRQGGTDLATALATAELGTILFNDTSFTVNGTVSQLRAHFDVDADGVEEALLGWGAVFYDAVDDAPDTSADEDGNLALTAPDTDINAAEATAVSLVVSGLDADADAVVSVTDGSATVTVTLADDGTVVLDLSSLADGALTTSVTATDTSANVATVAGPALTLDTTPLPDTSADADGNLALTAPDTNIDATEFTAVNLAVSGLDADADAVVSVTDGSATVTGALADDGTVVLDLSSLADGALTTEVTATDTTGNVATVAGPTLTLDKTPDTSADEDGNLALTAPDTDIVFAEMTAVSLVVSGLDADADAVVSVTDGSATVTGALADDGTVVLDLSSLSDGALTTLVTATDTSANTATVAGPGLSLDKTPPPDISADEDGNLALTAPDTDINAAEATAVSLVVSGLDADADAVVSVTDGSATVTGALADDGTVVLDLSSLSDGALTTLVTATDTTGNIATVAGPTLTLATTDTSADADANLSVSISGDTTIDASEVLATFFTISGLDGDATAVVTVSDGVASVSKTFVANGPGFLNLTGLADGALTSLVTATDTSGNVATVSGPGLTLDTTTGLNIVEQTAQNFNGTNAADLIDASDTLFAANNFILAGDQNDLVRGNAGNDQMHGGNGSDQIYGGDGHDYVYGQNGADALFGDVGSDGIFGGKGEDTIEGGAGNDVLRGGGQSDAFLYAVVGGSALGDDRIDDFNAVEGDAIVNTGDVDAALILSVGSDGKLEGSIRQGGTDLATALATAELGTILFNDTSFTVNGTVSQLRAHFDVDADGVEEALLGWGAVFYDAVDDAPDTSADEDGNLALTAPDTDINAAEATAVSLVVSGLDADADAVVSVTDGSATVTVTLADDGTVVLDLSSLADGALTTSVTATDTSANVATVAGPALTLDTTPLPDTSADADGNLALTAPDTNIDATEFTAVNLAVSGLDADADAVVSVTDGSATVTGALADDGTVVLDLSSLADGALTTEVTATDTTGNVATVAGPTLTLDKTPDTSADEDGNLALTAPDTDIVFAEMTAVSLVVSGLDADADAVVSVTDGSATVTGALADDGTVVLDLSSLSDGALTTLVTATDTSANTATVAGPGLSLDKTPPPDISADEDGNLALTAPDTDINAAEATAVSLVVSGLDADADAVVSVTDGSATVTGALADDGTVVLDLSSLSDGALTTLVTATDTTGNIATVAGPTLTLATTDTSADADANLSVSISGDTTIDASEVLATFFTISGLDGDATAVVTVSDGVASVSKTFVANGPGFLNLTGLADGALTSLVTATDTSGNVATVSGPGLTLDTTTGLNIVEQTAQNFNGTNAADLIDASDTLFAANNFILAGDQNDLVRGNAGNDQMHGGNGSDQIYGGDGHDYVYGQNGADALFGDVGSDGIFGGKGEDTIEGGAGNDVLRGGGQSDAFLYAVVGGSALGDDRIDDFNAVEGDAIVNTGDVDAALILSVGSDGKLEGSIRQGGTDLATALATAELGTILFNDTSFTVNGTVSQLRAHFDVDADGVEEALLGWGAVFYDAVDDAPDTSADEDGNLALTAPDTDINAAEATAVSLVVSGLDADADAVVSVTDGSATVTVTLADDGTVVLDLSSLADGALTTSVTATDTSANVATVAGPALTLDTTPLPDTSADADGNLALTAPDTNIDATEFTAVNLAVSGLDADADAVVSVTDGSATVTGALADDGTVVLDLSSLADGALTTEVTATDTTGNIAKLTGPSLTLNKTTISLADQTRALSIDLSSQTFSFAARVLPIGDSLTLGAIDVNLPFVLAELEGWREDLFESLVSQNIWIDYVGNESNGPTRMLDKAHSGDPGISIAKILDGRSEIANIPNNVADHDPDVMLFMAGTNDFRITNFFNRFNSIVNNTRIAIDQFYQSTDSLDQHMVVSTVPPKISRGPEEAILSDFLREGYSLVNGEAVVGDVGNGTYQSGVRHAVEEAQQIYPNLHLFENPWTVDDLSTDLVHFTQAGNAIYADALSAFLLTEVGVTGGTLDGAATGFTPGTNLTAGQAGDLIIGSAAADDINGGGGNDVIRGAGGNDTVNGGEGDDRLYGEAGSDLIIGGTGADAFVFGSDFANGPDSPETDIVMDFSDTEDWFVFDSSFDDNIVVTDDPDSLGVILTVSDNANVIGEIIVQGAEGQALKGANLGSGIFALTDDPTLAVFELNPDFLLS